jgi:TIR domain
MADRTGVFISHITEEKPVALVLQAYIRKAFGDDFKVFVSSDSKSIGGGERWFEYIIQNLRTSRVILVLVSQESRRGEWINFEAGFGDGGEAIVIPVSIRNFPIGQLLFPLAGYQGRSADDIGALLDDIRNAVGMSAGDIDTKAYQSDLNDAEDALRYKSLKIEPVVEGHYLRFDIENTGNVDLELLMLEVLIPQNAVSPTFFTYSYMEMVIKPMNGEIYKWLAGYSPRGAYANITPVLRPVLTPSMGIFRPGIEINIVAVAGAAREQVVYFKVHAINYSTDMEERKIADLNWP